MYQKLWKYSVHILFSLQLCQVDISVFINDKGAQSFVRLVPICLPTA